VRKGRLPGEEIPDGIIPVVPDLVLEVKSPSDTWMDLFAKLLEYLRAGVLVVVFLDPARRTASIYRNDEQTVLLESANFELPDLLPGLTVPVARFFA
ncbi:MAG: Uma2 family endonuclease, partial [Gemmataceae bacterium]|nr:Uma2 family endonuclease [Gemmataceae bacterium]